MEDIILKTTDLTKKYNNKAVVDNLNIEIRRGEIFGLLGPNGAGKTTIINFWGTWCTPCVNELPYFDQIASEYKDDVTVIAIHSSMSSETASGYIKDHYPESDIIFATDDAKDDNPLSGACYELLGGRGAYPYTVVLDENGIITDIFVSSVEYQDLKDVVEKQLSNQKLNYKSLEIQGSFLKVNAEDGT